MIDAISDSFWHPPLKQAGYKMIDVFLLSDNQQNLCADRQGGFHPAHLALNVRGENTRTRRGFFG